MGENGNRSKKKKLDEDLGQHDKPSNQHDKHRHNQEQNQNRK